MNVAIYTSLVQKWGLFKNCVFLFVYSTKTVRDYNPTPKDFQKRVFPLRRLHEASFSHLIETNLPSVGIFEKIARNSQFCVIEVHLPNSFFLVHTRRVSVVSISPTQTETRFERAAVAPNSKETSKTARSSKRIPEFWYLRTPHFCTKLVFSSPTLNAHTLSAVRQWKEGKWTLCCWETCFGPFSELREPILMIFGVLISYARALSPWNENKTVSRKNNHPFPEKPVFSEQCEGSVA